MEQEDIVLFQEYARTRSIKLRNELVLRHEKLAWQMANRFQTNEAPVDELIQVARLGLISAVDRFDPSRGISFSTFATPTIIGAMKRYFRDENWSVKVPRELKELGITASRLAAKIEKQGGPLATPSELAKRLQVKESRIAAAFAAGALRHSVSLESGLTTDENSGSLADTVGAPDPALGLAELRCVLAECLGRLDELHRKVIYLRYYCQLTQQEVALRLGLPQTEISSIQRRALNRLRKSWQTG